LGANRNILFAPFFLVFISLVFGGKVIIGRVTGIPIQMPLEKPFRGGTYTISNRYTVIIAVQDDQDKIQGLMYGGDEDMDQAGMLELINGPFQEILKTNR